MNYIIMKLSILCHYAECRDYFNIMLSVVMLSVYAECRDYFNAMLSVVMLSVVMLSVVAPSRLYS